MSPTALVLVAVSGVALLLVFVLALRLHAFIALLLVSLFVALAGGVPLDQVIQVIQDGMGSTLGFIAIVVGLGAMFGELLRVSGGAEALASALLKTFGERRAPWALGLTGFIVAIPVFFDVGLIILLPLACGLARKTGRSLLLYALPLAAGLAIGHSYIPPTPGPVAVASLLGVELGWVILFGTLAGLPAMVCGGVLFGRYAASRVRAAPPGELAEPTAEATTPSPYPAPTLFPPADLRSPSAWLVAALIGLPLVLILLNTVSTVMLPEGHAVRAALRFLGHPFTALLGATLLAFRLLGTRLGLSRQQVHEAATRSLEPVGLIILVTGAGGVLGKTLVASGVGKALAAALAAAHLPLVVLAFVIAAAVRVTQGSATVAMVSAAGLLAPVTQAMHASPPLLGLLTISIASGATVLSHVNDSGFWLVSRYLGLSEKDTLRTWTVLETILGGVGFAVVAVLSLFVK